MSMIEKITRLKHPSVLRDFTWPAELPAFGRFNLIYGWNGSGKTTLSRLLRHLELRSAPAAGEVTLRIDGRNLVGQDFESATTAVRVFNRDFINESIFPMGGGDVPPIFVVGKESVDKQKEVDRLRGERTARDKELADAKISDERTAHELDKHCTDQARAIKDALRAPGTGAYNEYDKRAYRQRVEKMAVDGDANSRRLDDKARDNFLVQHRATAKPKVSAISYLQPVVQQLHREVEATLAMTVTSAALQVLKEDPALGDWTRDGLKLHNERASLTCLFCEQPLPPGRLGALEAHFSAEYDRFLQHVDELESRMKVAKNQVNSLRLPDRAALYEDLIADYDAAQQALQEALANLDKNIAVLIEGLDNKKHLPFTSLAFDVTPTEIGANVVSPLNEVIQRHNTACDEFQSRTTTARDHLAFDMIARSLGEYSRLEAAAKASAHAIGPIQADVQRLDREITRLERDIVEHRQPAEELNEDLRKYLGHDELHLGVKDTGYVLMRHGLPADSLSEGERTALALLYFLKSLDDRRFDLRQGVVVLDDPVSSLDANALYLAFGFIRHRTQDAAQLFLLTHNFTFFRQVRNWFHHLKGQNKKKLNQRPARFYMLDRVRDTNTRCTTLQPLDPLLEQYESEYHYLFACVHREANAALTSGLEQSYGLPNIARRLLEMFLAFRQPQVSGELWQKLKDIDFDEARKVRIVRFVHAHSHGDTIGEPEHDPSLLGEARSVLGDLLEFIKSQDHKHFAAMMELVAPTGAAGEQA